MVQIGLAGEFVLLMWLLGRGRWSVDHDETNSIGCLCIEHARSRRVQ
jgi:hypothetical protein